MWGSQEKIWCKNSMTIFSRYTLEKTSQELRKLPYASYLENQVKMSDLFVLWGRAHIT